MGVAHLIILVFPIAIVFAILGRHYPSAGGVAHFVGMAFGSRLERVTGWLFYRSFRGFACRATNCCRIRRAMFGWHSWQLLLAELGTLALVWYIGTRGASSSANLQTVIAGLIVALIVAIWWAGDIKPASIPFPRQKYRTYRVICCVISDVLVFCRSGSICPSCLGI